jgi:hypothetical protein
MKRKPALVVPVRDRRNRKRVLTLKNFRNAILVVAVLLLAVILQSNLRHTKSGNYGRLFGKQVSGQVDVVQPKMDVVREAPVPEQPSADALLISSAAREQYLGVNGVNNVAPPVANSEVIAPPAPVTASPGGVTIVGGTEGVTLTRGEAKKQPTLSGGIFRQ